MKDKKKLLLLLIFPLTLIIYLSINYLPSYFSSLKQGNVIRVVEEVEKTNNTNQFIDPEEVFGELDEAEFYKFLRLNEKGEVNLDEGIVNEVVKQVVKRIKVRRGELVFNYEFNTQELRIAFLWVGEDEETRVDYTISLKRN